MVINPIADPVAALVAVGKENSELHEELAKVYAECDRYRNALMVIAGMPSEILASDIARKAIAHRVVT